ncbi:MAG TPA: hypothetical protein VIK47_08865 [Kiloniellales bacterium]
MSESVKTTRNGPIFDVVLDRPTANAIVVATMRAKGFPAFERLLVGADITEGPRTFAEKRDPVWQGR